MSTIRYFRERAEGRQHRAWLRAHILPRLYLGARVPSGQFLGRILSIDGSSAGKHMRQVLREAGIRTEQRYVTEGGCRVYVVEIPALQVAA